MRLQYFGDSYDIVKKSLIAWLSEFGPWVTHPMFTEDFKSEDAAAFSRLLGTSLLSLDVLSPRTNRAEYFSSCRTAGNLFLDPDTGVCLEERRGKKSENYVFGVELVEWCAARPSALTLIFDQSYSRGEKKDILLQKKLQYFAQNKISGIAYNSHASFLLLGADPELIKRVHERLIVEAGLPEWRLAVCDGSLSNVRAENTGAE